MKKIHSTLITLAETGQPQSLYDPDTADLDPAPFAIQAWITSVTTNTGTVYLGAKNTVDAATETGIPLTSGERFELEYVCLKDLWANSTDDGDKVSVAWYVDADYVPTQPC